MSSSLGVWLERASSARGLVLSWPSEDGGGGVDCDEYDMRVESAVVSWDMTVKKSVSGKRRLDFPKSLVCSC